ncbi:MAG: XdhC/CoxI family protein [Hyphomicrobiaceae bacterium]|nr:XdhC/CoxI family protein [Hyphomicrobiaceae bacterium]
MKDIIDRCCSVLAAGQRCVMATVVSTWGSAPVPVGGTMLIEEDRSFSGSVSGGCVEGEVIAEAASLLKSGGNKRLSYGVADEQAWSVGLPCGGSIEVLLSAWVPDDIGLARAIGQRMAERSAVGVVTDLETGRRWLAGRDGDHTGWLQPGGGTGAVVEKRLAEGASGLEVLGDGRAQFVHVLRPTPRIVVIGGVHIAQVLARLAPDLGFEVIIVDPREAFAAPARFPGCRVVTQWPEEALPAIGLDADTAVVVLSHVARIDDEALLTALRSEPGYIGALGSRRSHAKRRERLAAAGIGAQRLDDIRAPIGLDIGAQNPAEIALAILAQVVQARRVSAGARTCAAA